MHVYSYLNGRLVYIININYLVLADRRLRMGKIAKTVGTLKDCMSYILHENSRVEWEGHQKPHFANLLKKYFSDGLKKLERR